jgi:hypothetical protein
MKPSNSFKEIIQQHLEARAQADQLFAATFAKEGKNIDDCCTYILNTVQKSGNNGFADEEIFGMAVHYYDEDKIEVGKPVNAKVVVNHSLPAEKPIKHETKQAPAAAPKPKAEKKTQFVTGSLFD